HERSHPLQAHLAKEFVERIHDELPNSHGVILQDYAKGIWNSDTVSFIRHARELKKPVFVDPNRHTPLALYHGSTLMTPNLAEAETLSRRFSHYKREDLDFAHLKAIAKDLVKGAALDHAIVTCSEHGMVAMNSSQEE